jgi:hypothetical protein
MHFGLEAKLAYGHQLPSQRPTWLGARFSFPAGRPLLDDRQLQMGIMRAWNLTGSWTLAGKAFIGHSRHANAGAKLNSITSDLGLDFGYYKPRGYIALGLGWEEFLATKVQHTDFAREIYPEIQDGWLPAFSSGNIAIGLAAGYSIQKFDLFLAAARVLDHRLQSNYLVPFSAELGLGYSF